MSTRAPLFLFPTNSHREGFSPTFCPNTPFPQFCAYRVSFSGTNPFAATFCAYRVSFSGTNPFAATFCARRVSFSGTNPFAATFCARRVSFLGTNPFAAAFCACRVSFWARIQLANNSVHKKTLYRARSKQTYFLALPSQRSSPK